MTLYLVSIAVMLFTVYSVANPGVEDLTEDKAETKKEDSTDGEDEKEKEDDIHEEEDARVEKDDISVEDGEFSIALLNKKISNYLRSFEQIKKQSSDGVVKKVMGIVRQLITVSWIHMLKPDFRYVPRGGRDLEEVKNDLIKELKEIDTVKPVSEAILIYSDGIEQEIKEHFEAQKNDILKRIERINEEYKKPVSVEEYEKLTSEFEESTEKLEIVDENLKIHKIASKMCLQTYISEFLQNSVINSDTFVVASRNEMVTKSFRVPSMDSGVFMEGLDADE